MLNTSRERQEQLATWLHRLTETLRLQGGETWKALVQIVSGKTAIIALDGTTLQVSAEGGDCFQLCFDYVSSAELINFSSDADTLRDLVAGRLTVDGALANGRIYACNNLDGLLGIYEVVMRILADSATNQQLQELWMEFDQSWSAIATRGLPSLLEEQKLCYGYFISSLPEDVLSIEVKHYLAEDQR